MTFSILPVTQHGTSKAAYVTGPFLTVQSVHSGKIMLLLLDFSQNPISELCVCPYSITDINNINITKTKQFISFYEI